MVWASMCFRVISSLYSVGQETYVNTHHHFDNVLKPFLRNDLHRLFPGGEKNMILHTDSGLSHTPKYTLNLFKERGVNNVNPEERMPKSPGATPMDFSIWGVLKMNLQMRKVPTLSGLKTALKKSGGTCLI